MSQKKKAPPVAATPAPRATSLLRSLLHGTCLWFTGISVFVLIFNLLFPSNSAGYVNALSFLLFLPFGFALTVAGTVRRAPTLPTSAKVILHPLCSLGGFYICFYLPYQLTKKPTAGQVLAILVLAAVVYGVIVGAISLWGRRTRQKKLDDTPYESQFGRKS